MVRGHQDRLQACASGVDGSGQTGGSGSDDDYLLRDLRGQGETAGTPALRSLSLDDGFGLLLGTTALLAAGLGTCWWKALVLHYVLQQILPYEARNKLFRCEVDV